MNDITATLLTYSLALLLFVAGVACCVFAVLDYLTGDPPPDDPYW